MKLVNLRCPNCGAMLDINPNQSIQNCAYCDASILIETNQPQKIVTPPSHENISYPKLIEKKKKKHTWLWVIGWIFFFPIPLSILIWRSERLPKKVRILLICSIFLLFLLAGFSNQSAKPANASKINEVQQG
ncbi:MAG: hypothetical protein HUJ53_08470, partial [Holdemanella sp.]|nr:hypothetical protein [Holdemanella sp.]